MVCGGVGVVFDLVFVDVELGCDGGVFDDLFGYCEVGFGYCCFGEYVWWECEL